ncbi:MAG: IS66 family transposase [Opitutae bacterium]|nr:IS66 family transposase [Opitutae bacterium]
MTNAAPALADTEKRRRSRPVLEVLQELLSTGRTEEVVALVAKLLSRNTELERLLNDVKAKGKPREGVSTAQLVLLLGGLSTESNPTLAEADAKLRESSGIDEKHRQDETKAARERRRREAPARRPLPAHLPRVNNIIPVPDAQRPCPLCGAPRKCIGHDVTEVLELIPAQLFVRRDCREKLACKPCDGEPVRAPLGNKVVAGGKMGTALVAQVIVDKYRDGLPLTRQVERFERMGIDIPVSTLADQVRWATEALQPLWRAALAKVLRADVLHLDATSLPVLDKDVPGGIRLGSLWGYVGAEVSDAETLHTALYLYATTGKKNAQREGELGPEDVLALREGDVVADASGLFDASFKRKELHECGCNMHARRRFTKALDAGDTRAALPLAAFKKLYVIEKELQGATIEERLRVRQKQSRPVYDDLLAWMRVRRPYEPPSSGMGQALQYLDNHHVALTRFLGSGVVPIDNGVVERLHVRAALTRKNFLFAGSDAGAERAAVAYTLLGCCALVDVDPVRYLADVLPRLAARRVRLRDVPALLPASWKVTHPTSILAQPTSAAAA